MAGNFVAKPSNGWYCRVDRETGELVDPKVRLKDTLSGEFWKPVLENPEFIEFIKKQFTIGYKPEIEDLQIDENEL